MFLDGLYITTILVPKMVRYTPKPDEPPALEFLKAQQQISLAGHVNLFLGLAVLFLLSGIL